jgi:hypothetical protein
MLMDVEMDVIVRKPAEVRLEGLLSVSVKSPILSMRNS